MTKSKSRKSVPSPDKTNMDSEAPFWHSYIIPPTWRNVTPYELATLAARLSLPKNYEMAYGAVEAAIQLIEEAATISDLRLKLFETGKAEKPITKPLEHVVKYITGQKRPELAMRYFRQFVAAHGYDDDGCERQIKLAREKGLNRYAASTLKHAYSDWKAENTSPDKWKRLAQNAADIRAGKPPGELDIF
jgi:hypothetical protein